MAGICIMDITCGKAIVGEDGHFCASQVEHVREPAIEGGQRIRRT